MGTEIEKLQELLKNDPSNFQARRELSVLLSQEGFNEEALANLQFLTKYFPEDADLHYNLGILYEKLKDLEKAELSYTKAIEISPQSDFYYNLGEVLVALQEWDRAIKVFKIVLKEDPKDSNCYFNIGVCYYNKDEINLAIDNFQQAVNINPQDLFAHFYLGNIYQSRGLTKFAIDSYNKVLSISPDYSWAYFNLAAIAYKNDNWEDAKDYLLKTIRYNKNDIEAYKLLTQLYLKENQADEIITILETRLKKEANGDLFYILAQVYKYIERNEDYADCLLDALENPLTLTYPKDLVQKESDWAESLLDNRHTDEDKEFESVEDENIAEEEEDNEDEDDFFEEEDDEFLDEEDI